MHETLAYTGGPFGAHGQDTGSERRAEGYDIFKRRDQRCAIGFRAVAYALVERDLIECACACVWRLPSEWTVLGKCRRG